MRVSRVKNFGLLNKLDSINLKSLLRLLVLPVLNRLWLLVGAV